ncbi:hypothetical protein BDW62DRAFT_183384 [Aspergillus aurantiobrunneus]
MNSGSSIFSGGWLCYATAYDIHDIPTMGHVGIVYSIPFPFGLTGLLDSLMLEPLARNIGTFQSRGFLYQTNRKLKSLRLVEEVFLQSRDRRIPPALLLDYARQGLHSSVMSVHITLELSEETFARVLATVACVIPNFGLSHSLRWLSEERSTKNRPGANAAPNWMERSWSQAKRVN